MTTSAKLKEDRDNARSSTIAAFVVAVGLLTFHGGGILNALPYAYSGDSASVCGARMIIDLLTKRVTVVFIVHLVACIYLVAVATRPRLQNETGTQALIAINSFALLIDFYIVILDILFFHHLPSVSDVSSCHYHWPALY